MSIKMTKDYLDESLINDALGFNPVNPDGSSGEYIKGDGTKGTFPTLASVATSGSYNDLSNKPNIPAAQINTDWNSSSGLSQLLNKPSLSTVATSGSYNDLSNKPTITSGTVTSVGLTSTDFSISGSPVTTSGNITANLNTTGVSAATYNSSYTVDSKGRITAATNASFNSSPGRSLSTTGSNNTFTISTTKNARVNYTVNFAASLTLTTSNGLVSLDYSTDGGSNWIPVSSVSQVYSLAITIATNADCNLSGEIPANALVRIYRSSNTNVTVSLTKQQEITY